MINHTDKIQEHKNQSVASGIIQKKGTNNSTFQFAAIGPEAIAQRNLQELAHNSHYVKQAAQLQAMANNYPAQQQQAIQKKENNTGLPDNLKSGIENLSGFSMDDVKVHYNSDKPAQLQAHAYAQGTDIHLASGQEKHLPHEAWHVVQQQQGRVRPTLQMKGGVNINDDAGLEKEADLMGAKAVQFVDNKQKDSVVDVMTFQMMNKNIIQMIPEKKSIIPFKHSIDGEEDPKKSPVHVDSSKLLDGKREGTNRAFMTVFAATKKGSKFKDIQYDEHGKIKATEGDDKQTWINFGDPRRAQHYAVTYSLQHLKSDHKKQFDIAQEAANVARIHNFCSIKMAVRAHEAENLNKRSSSLFEDKDKFNDTRKSLAKDRLGVWGDEGPIIRSFLVDDTVTEQLLNAAVVESDKKKTQSNVINVDQTKAANQIGISGNAKSYFFEKGIQQGSLESIVPNLDSSIQGTSSFEMFEEMHNLESTFELIARLGSNPTISLPQTDVVRERRSKFKK